MKVDYLEKQLSLTGSLAQDSLSVVAERVKGLLTRSHVHEDKMSYWQLIFLQSNRTAVSTTARISPKSTGNGPKIPGFRNS